MQRFLSLGAVLLAVWLPAGPQPDAEAAPAAPKPVALAFGETDPFAFSWLDLADGTTASADALATQIHDIFADADYLIQDNGQILIGHFQDNQLNPIFIVNERHDDKGTRYVFHQLVRGTKSFQLLDGSVTRDPQDSTKGLVILTLHFVDEQGNIGTTYLEQSLQFQKLNGQ